MQSTITGQRAYPFPVSLSEATPEETNYYEHLAERVGCSVDRALVLHNVMYMSKRHPMQIVESDYFHSFDPATREFLFRLTRKVREGEHLPDF